MRAASTARRPRRSRRPPPPRRLDFDGKRVRYQLMPHDTAYPQPTCSSHAWLMTGYDETPSLIVVAAEQPGRVTIR
jgi:hypothetical protein